MTACATCTRKCCHHYTVTVTGHDVWVITQALRLAPEQFLVVVPMAQATPRGFRLDRGEQTYEIALDKAASRAREKPCVFWLAQPGGIGRCGIYPVRPQVCRTYPAYMDGDVVRRREDVLCPGAAWRDGTLEDPSWHREIRRMQVELDIYTLAVARWNHHVDHGAHPERLSSLAYLAYLMAFYGRMEAVRTTVDDDEWARMCEPWGALAAAGDSPLAHPAPAMVPWTRVLAGIRAVSTSLFPEELVPLERAGAPD